MAQFTLNSENKSDILAAYYNMARGNFFRTICHIFNVAGVKLGKGFDEEGFAKILRSKYKSLAGMKNEMTEDEKSADGSLKINSLQQEKIRQMLFKYFPILAPTVNYVKTKAIGKEPSENTDEYQIMKGATLVDCLKVISEFATCITDIRNKYTHLYAYNTNEEIVAQYSMQKIIARYLDIAIVASRRKVKQRDRLGEQRFEFLTGRLHFDLISEDEHIENLKKLPLYKKEPWMDSYLENRPKVLERDFVKKGKRIPTVSVEKEDYYFNVKTWIEFRNDHFKVLSDFGLLYICCLFLSRNYAKRLMEESLILNNTPKTISDSDKSVILKVVQYYCIRAPKGRRLDTDDTNIQLGMDMLNELRKCPNELYELLGANAQSSFEDNIEEPSGIDENGNPRYQITGEKFKRIRHTDRFAELALRFIDQSALFDQIRFQVRLGKYRFRFYEKDTIDGDRKLRILQKDINGFGCLNKIEEARKEKWGNLIKHGEIRTVGENEIEQLGEDTADSTPYVTDARATYNINENRIGLYWNINGNGVLAGSGSGRMFIPTLGTVDQKALVNQPAPLATLSTRELPALVFYEHLRSSLTDEEKNKYNSAEKIIFEQYKKIVKFFTGISDGSITTLEQVDKLGIKLSDIPYKLKEYLGVKGLKKERDQNQRLSDAVIETNGLLRKKQVWLERKLEVFRENRGKVGDKDNKFAKKNFVDIRPGSLARYLGKSIISWQKNNEKFKKLTGLNYSVMVSMLAGFGTLYTLDDIKALFVKAGIIKDPNYKTKKGIYHPFLQDEVLNKSPRNIEEFYDLYVSAEILKIGDIRKNAVKKDTKNIKNTIRENIPLAYPDRVRWQDRNEKYYKDLAGRYLQVDGIKVSIQLPDGLFTQAILDLLRDKFPENELFKEIPDNSNEHVNDRLNSVSYLIGSYLDSVMEDQSQEFYCMDTNSPRFKREYKFFTVLINEFAGNELKVQFRSPKEIMDFMKSKNKDEKIANRCNNLTEDEIEKMKEKDSYSAASSVSSAREKMNNKLTKLMKECRNNERTLRRYRIQDIVIFMMAKHLLKETLGDGANSFKLSNVTSRDFLNNTVTFRQPITLEDNTRVDIVQKNVSIKNYNMAFRYMRDDRLQSLLSQLVKLGVLTKTENGYEVSYSMLYGEFGTYDQNRTKIFGIIHQIEKIIIDNNPELMNENSEKSYFISKNNGKRVPVRNSFSEMLKYIGRIGGKEFSDDDKELAVSVRNAFSHNHYPTKPTSSSENRPTSKTGGETPTEDSGKTKQKDLYDILKGENVALPLVAQAIEKKLEEVSGTNNNKTE